jgi:hypothetical protein
VRATPARRRSARWCSTWIARHQLVIAADNYGGSLVVVVTSLGLDADRAGSMHVTLTTHGLDDEQFAEVDRTWRARWTALADDAQVTPYVRRTR